MAVARWVLFILIGIAAAGQCAAQAYLTSNGEAARAVHDVLKKAGRAPQVLRIDIAPGHVAVLTRNPTDGQNFDRWTHGGGNSLMRLLSAVSGPDKVPQPVLFGDGAAMAFKPADVALDRVETIVRDALQYAVMDGSARVEMIRIGRQISPLQKSGPGELQWTIQLKSPKESASVVADAQGRIIGADLSQTLRGRTLDARRDDWVLPKIAKRLAPHLGTEATLWSVSFSGPGVHVVTSHPDKPGSQRTFGWTLDQVTRNLFDVPSTQRLFHRYSAERDPEMGPEAPRSLRDRATPFAFSELDLGVLPAAKKRARAVLQLPNGEITGIDAEKNRGMKIAQWEIEVTSGDGRRVATVTFDGKGDPEEVRPHEDSMKSSSKAVRDWAAAVRLQPARFARDEEAYERARHLHFKVLGGADTETIHQLGLVFTDRETVLHDYRAAAHWFVRAADEGHATSMYFLGILQGKGQGLPLDPTAAARWFEKASEAGHADAMYALGFLYVEGKGVSPDDRKAVDWFQQSAAKGNIHAMYNLGYMFLEGRGIERSTEKAQQWFVTAAENGHPDAFLNLSYMYAQGLGVTRDDQKAAGYLLDAIKAGSVAALEGATVWDPAFRAAVQTRLKQKGSYQGPADGLHSSEWMAALRALFGK